MVAFLEWMDTVLQGSKFALTANNVYTVSHMLFTRYTDGKGIRGSQKATMRRFLDITMLDLKKELPNIQPEITEWKVTPGFRRNQICWCGKDRKYKRCHNGELPS